MQIVYYFFEKISFRIVHFTCKKTHLKLRKSRNNVVFGMLGVLAGPTSGWQVTAPECLSAIRDYQISRRGPMTTPIEPTAFQLTSLQAPQTEGRLLAPFESRLVIADDGTIRLQKFTWLNQELLQWWLPDSFSCPDPNAPPSLSLSGDVCTFLRARWARLLKIKRLFIWRLEFWEWSTFSVLLLSGYCDTIRSSNLC